ncbi:2Fe-2S iron-sulfur cluster-binding protein [Pelomonas sp. KK5]|uniref:2Fe-2S iron-sulfur cluster-binding protein n=1 Tax=Pelomonas sp. KK5 TaxID=1855730 RepID=UPI0009F8751D|nr:2Fe-2S iron-sulfur cluster-binding protein [Pelomonas sp. KK5]
MPELQHRPVIDPAIENDWFAVARCDDLQGGQVLRRRLLQREIELRRSGAAGPAASVVGDADAPCAVREHCGHLFVCLGAEPKALFALPEFDQAGRRFLYMGAIGVHTGGLRVVENFLDMAHFPFVHAHILGSEDSTEVRPYEVELDARNELWARGCRFVQPMASAASDGQADVDYVYRVVNPFSPLLYKAPAGHAGGSDIIFLFVQPTEEDRCIVHFSISLFDAASSGSEILAFQQTILGQDKPILENHVYKRLPLDARLEVPSQADAGSSTYRRWLRRIGLRWGVEPAPDAAPEALQLVVADRRPLTDDIVAFVLRSPAGGPLPPAAPGAHLDVHLDGGLVRQYSLCNAGSDEDDVYAIAVKREPQSRGGSRLMHEGVRVGDLLRVGMPKNNFRQDRSATRSLLLAGGIGITPLISMARALRARSQAFHLHYFCRSDAQVAFREELDRELAGQWTLHAGLTPEETRSRVDGLLHAEGPATHCYSCGPTPLMQLVETCANGQGWDAKRLHFEYFRSAGPVETGGAPFELTLARSGRSVLVPSGQSIVDVLRSIDVAVETNCEQGVCGTCLCTVVDGTPDHRDQYLSAGEKASNLQMLPCVSRSRTPSLTIDL